MTDQVAQDQNQQNDAGIDAELLSALRHPLRRRILVAAAQLDVVSPSLLAVELREPLSNTSYHVRDLADRGALRLIDTQPVRGSVQHFYCFSVDAPWALAVLGVTPGRSGQAAKEVPDL